MGAPSLTHPGLSSTDTPAPVVAGTPVSPGAATGPCTATFSAANKPGSTNATSPSMWMYVVVNGVQYLLPLFPV